jgi:hypothetical protein
VDSLTVSGDRLTLAGWPSRKKTVMCTQRVRKAAGKTVVIVTLLTCAALWTDGRSRRMIK